MVIKFNGTYGEDGDDETDSEWKAENLKIFPPNLFKMLRNAKLSALRVFLSTIARLSSKWVRVVTNIF